MSCERPIPLRRVYFLNPGETLDVGDRMLNAFRPPLYDNPATVGCFDTASGCCFTSDCFGAPMPSAADARAADVRTISRDELADRQRLWTSVDSPWVAAVDPAAFERTIEPLRAFAPSAILSTHLPPAIDVTDALIETARQAPGIDPFVGPDQAALDAMLRTFEPVA
ncbi:MAG TPA: hypothetical protein VH333_09905 [Pseudonocardiaceae bacterium]|nr:hypothetical protein [Pseudonocardiaceae bacterium]